MQRKWAVSPRQPTSRVGDGRRGELALLGEIRQRAARASSGVRVGIGDDCALLQLRPGEELAVTTDLSIDGRHFRLDWHPPESVGHRTLARGLSDLAAMGARPVAAFLSLGLPAEMVDGSGGRFRSKFAAGSRSWIGRFFNALLALADSCGVPLAGGDLAESPVALADIVLAGAAPRGKALLRSGARPGDSLYVTGALGGSAAALQRLAALAGAAKPAGTSKGLRISKADEAGLAAHLYPQPRIAQGLWLRKHAVATAAIDLSDGLSTDLAHLCEESSVSAEVDAASLPVHAGARLDQALHGGEDYELLFTAAPGAHLPRVIAGVAVTQIGRVVRPRSGEPQVVLISERGRQALEPRGWEHFSQ